MNIPTATEVARRVGKVQTANDASIKRQEVRAETSLQERKAERRKEQDSLHYDFVDEVRRATSNWQSTTQEQPHSNTPTYAMVRYADAAYNSSNRLTEQSPKGNKYQRYA